MMGFEKGGMSELDGGGVMSKKSKVVEFMERLDALSEEFQIFISGEFEDSVNGEVE